MYSFEINILCDHCEERNNRTCAEIFTSTPLESSNIEEAKKEAVEEGWRFDGDIAICPLCVEAGLFGH